MNERRVGAWDVVHERTTAGALHSRDLPTDRRAIHVVEVTAAALVLGSTQTEADVDLDVARDAHVEVTRRRSGGGAVLLVPGGQVWIDVIVPRDDELWDDDVARATYWLGEAWVAALAAIGITGAVVHRGAMVTNPLSPVVCFAGVGPGEVTIDGAKCVGISQRRTRDGARFQCSIPATWDLDLHRTLLAPGIDRVNGDPASILVRSISDSSRLLDSFLGALPRSTGTD